MYMVISFFHVIACFALILFILLQAGRGGGLSDMFGAGVQQQQKLFGTESNTILTKATTFCAVVFVITSMILGLMTTQKSRSLITPQGLRPVFPSSGETPESGGVFGGPGKGTQASAGAPVSRAESPKAASNTPSEDAQAPAKK